MYMYMYTLEYTLKNARRSHSSVYRLKGKWNNCYVFCLLFRKNVREHQI